MRGLLIDDEALALLDLKRQLTRIGGVDVLNTFQDVGEALEAAASLRPDVVFLDIDMPEINGLEAAERLQDIHPSVEVVFVTAYEDYAVKAFELQALDYVLKPVQTERLALTVRRIEARLKDKDESAPVPSGPAFIRCFQRMQIDYGKQEQLAWRTVKAQELFAYLLFRKDQLVRKDTLVEILWPEVELKKAYTQLYTTIYQLRRSLEAAGISVKIANAGNSYSLDLGGISSDVEQWESRLRNEAELESLSDEQYEEWLNLYRGDYFEEHGYLWAENERQRLLNLWRHHAVRFAKKMERKGKEALAADWYLRIQQRLPYAEETYSHLMKLYARQGERSLAEMQYQRLREMMREEYDAEPSAEIQAWYSDWKRL